MTVLPSSGTRAADPFPWRLLAAVALGLPGVVTLAATAYVQLGTVETATPRWVAALVTAVQPAILLVGAAAVGAALAPRVGLRSHVLARVTDGYAVSPRVAADTPVALVAGAAAGAVGVAADAGLQLPAVSLVATDTTVSELLLLAPVRLVYGGVTEELLVRFGLLTLFAWVGVRLSGRETLSRAVGWSAVVGSAVAFGLLHLPTLLGTRYATTAVAVRVVALNAVVGVVFGWLYWRRSLEAAMIAHATFHVVSILVSLALLVR